MRSGSSYLGEMLQLNGMRYYNELFTPELCRRSNIMPSELDDNISEKVIDEAFRYDDAGFKIIYGQSTPQTWARLILKRELKIIHIIRENLFRQFASIKYLEASGVSKAVKSERGIKCFGTDGHEAEPKDIKIMADVNEIEDFFVTAECWRWLVYNLFSGKNYFEIHFEDIFKSNTVNELFQFLDHEPKIIKRPTHVKTPRPSAENLFINYPEIKGYFSETKYSRFFED